MIATRPGQIRFLDPNDVHLLACGGRFTFGGSTPMRPDMCRDCKYVLAYREPEPKPPRKELPRLPHLTDAECRAARLAWDKGDRSPEVEAAKREHWRRLDARKRERKSA